MFDLVEMRREIELLFTVALYAFKLLLDRVNSAFRDD